MKSKRKRKSRTEVDAYCQVRLRVLERDGWRCQFCGRRNNLEVHHRTFRSHLGGDSEENLVTACDDCHMALHGLA